MKRLLEYFKDSIAEMRKVIWPAKDEVQASVKVVIVSLFVFTLILGAMDIGLAALVEWIF